jgi:Aerotolerance regulator N-terminal
VSFLNIALLGGAAAFLVPLIIHLLNRTRLQTVDWGAMHLLDAALQVNSRRFQWESLLLLLLRCLIPILFALGLARPVLTHLRSSAAQGQVALVSLLDDSLSMSATPAVDNPDSYYSRAQSQQTQLLRQQSQAELSVLTSGVAPRSLLNGSSFDSSELISRLATTEAAAGGGAALEALSQGAEQLTQMVNSNKQLVVASDFQASQWSGLPADQIQRIKNQFDSPTSPIQVTLMPVRESPTQSPLPNLSVHLQGETSVDPLASLFANDPWRVVAEVHNWSGQAVDNAKLIFRADGQALASESLSLAAGKHQQVEFACSFKQSGSHYYSVEIDLTDAEGIKKDAVTLDNMAFGAVRVREPIEILIIDPATADRRDSAGRLLQLALTAQVNDSSFKVQVLHRPPTDAWQRCQVLALVGWHYDDNFARQVDQYVKAGGGLLFLPSENLNTQHLNQLLVDQLSLLPARWLGKQSNKDQPLAFKRQQYQDPLLTIFNSGQEGDLTSAKVEQWYPLQLVRATEPVAPKKTTADSNATMTPDGTASSIRSARLLELEDDSLAIAQQAVGQGRVIQLGISPETKWSNLGLQPAFVPLVQRAILDLSGQSELPLQIVCGDSISLSLAQLESIFAGKKSGGMTSSTQANVQLSKLPSQWSLVGPIRQTATEFKQSTAPEPRSIASTLAQTYLLQLDDGQSSLGLPVLRYPGLYRLEANVAGGGAAPTAVGKHLWIAVGSEMAESDLKLLDAPQLEQLARQLGAEIINSAEEYQVSQSVLRDGQEIWRPLLLLLLVFLFVEILLARRVTRGAAV